MSNKHSATKVESHGLLHDQKIRRITGDVFAHLFLAILAVIWLVPIVWVFAESFNKNTAPYTSSFFPKEWTLDNYRVLFTDRNVLDFPKMFGTTFIIACFTCAISLIFVLSVAYCMSRMRFRVRKTFMNVVLILGMFPGIMAVTAIYFILKALGLSSGTMTTVALILVYSAGSGAGFYVMKGYMDTIPTSLDEAALLDGCTRFQVFHKIIIPICKPMIVYHGQGDLPYAIQLHRGIGPVAHAAEGIYPELVCPLRRGRGRDLRSDRHPVHCDAALLSGVHVGLREGLKKGKGYDARRQLRTAEYERRRTVPAVSGTAAGCRCY